MSVLRTKTRPTSKPLYIQKDTALELQTVWLDDNIAPDTKLKITHAESLDPYMFTKYEIRDIEINDDADYRYNHRIAFPPKPPQVEKPRETTAEERAFIKVKLQRVRQALIANGTLRGVRP
jgi:hypothetical protein